MKLTRQQEKDVLQVYNAYWNNYINGDVEAMHPLLDSHYTQVGSAEGEVFFNKKEAVQFLYDTIDQVAGKLQMRNRVTKLEQQDNIILIHEQCNLYALADKTWIFYSRFRASTLMQEKKEGWKITHQHSSFPDTRAEDGQNIAIDKIAEENMLLREAIKRRTVELDHKNRELEIEAALERVRSRTMAMHKSDELVEVIERIYHEFQKLGFDALAADLMIISEDKKGFDIWVSGGDGTEGPYRTPEVIYKHPHHRGTMNAWKKGEKVRITDLKGVQFTSYFKIVLDETLGLSSLSKETKENIFSLGGLIHTEVFTRHSCIRVASLEKRTEDQINIQKRFASVFEQTYTRFLDLQKAEAQTREALIEAALERVRAKAMAMHGSKDIADAIAILFNELSRLGIEMERCGIVILNESAVAELWSTTLSVKNKQVIDVITGNLDFNIHPLLQGIYQSWRDKKDFFSYELIGHEVQKYYEILEKSPGYRFPKIVNYPNRQIVHCFFFNEGNIFIYTRDEISDDENQILHRFTKVFSLTYRRYLDLINAEARAHEATKQASLERVRGEIASMRNKEDLNRITPLIWKELTVLKIPFIRCGVLIMDDKRKVIKTYLSTPDGQSLSAFELDYNSKEIAAGAVKHWYNNRIYQDHWDKEYFIRFMNNLISSGKIKDRESYQGVAPPPESLHLNLVPFKQGMLYVGNTSTLSEEELELVQSLARTFSIAYARYEDFKQLEEAKIQTEKTLNELKAAQTQLIHSEKMASLGELTAGIAHEIQNPLNFVNNFSEVNSELIEELTLEADKGNLEEVKAIAKDIRENEGKIIHHGKRADAIVMGMLQHSRTSSGAKEPTDINALADEYLRLSYHGMRAKDKSFHADFKTELDPSLPKINVIPQDIGRVLLNLINNAFYAVSEKAKKGIRDYKPRVVVSTGLIDGKVEIRVKDNGAGVPEQVRDKIFQPFFTTKPTGQGTGLGLSLSYDIVTKGHGGKLGVKTQEGGGSDFIVEIPIM